MRKLLVVLPMLLALVGGCDATRRDFSVCDTTYSDCLKGFTCNKTTGMCVPDTDAGIPDTPITDTGAPDTSPVDVSVADTKDAPVTTDATPIDTSAVDTTIIDAPIVDVAIPDTRIPDAAGTCSVDNDCVGVAAGAYCVNTKCVACKTSSQCNNDAGVPFCSAQNTCVSCAGASGPDGGSACPASAPICAASGGCVQCVKNSDCPNPNSAFCVQNQCVGCNAPGATASAPVSGGSDGGSVDSGARDAGAASGPCTGPTPVCAKAGTIAGQCVGCVTTTNDGGVTSSNCTGTTPICSTTATPAAGTMPAIPAYTCVPCTSDTQCADKGVGPGVCMFHQDGRCATDAETIYVRNTSGCITTGTSSATTPFCQPQNGIGAVTTSKRLVVMTGTGTSAGAFGIWTATFVAGSPQVSIIGQNGPVVAPGAADIGIHILSGNVYIRGLTVQGAGVAAAIAPSQSGIVVDSGSTIGLDRCYVMGNAGGLLVHNGAGFDVANSVFAQNISGTGDFGAFGGVSLGSVGTGLPSRFWFNTIADNYQFGIACTTGTQQLSAILFYNNAGGDVENCTVLAGSWAQTISPKLIAGPGFATIVGQPNLSTTYHLTAQSTSPCKDYIDTTPTNHPPDDIDGDPRPKSANGKLDCGADEY